MRTFLIAGLCMVMAAVAPAVRAAGQPMIEVTGSATVSIVPDRITVEVGMEEYYSHSASGDSALVRIPAIERRVRKVFEGAGVPDSLIIVADVGNYMDRRVSAEFLMAKRLSAVVTSLAQVEQIAEKLERQGIVAFNIAKIDNTEIARYNREGLKAALDAARQKAEFIAQNEGLTIVGPLEIVENGPNYYETPAFSNVAFESGAGMENMRRIVRRYSVKVKYAFQ